MSTMRSSSPSKLKCEGLQPADAVSSALAGRLRSCVRVSPKRSVTLDGPGRLASVQRLLNGNQLLTEDPEWLDEAADCAARRFG